MRKFLGRLAWIVGAVGVSALITVGVLLFQYAESLADHEMHPPRKPITRTPTDVGIGMYQEVSFVTSDGLTIRGWFIPGSNGAAVILGHGNQGNRADMLTDAATLSGHGYSVLVFDWRGQGLSDGDTISFGQFEALDAIAAVDFVRTQPGVDPDRIGAEGFSLGASSMTLAASRDERIRAVIIEDTFTTLQDVANYRTQQLPFVGAMAMQIGQQKAGVDAGQVRPVDAICRISPRPVLLIYGAQDDYIPPGSADAMFAAACEPKDLWIVPGVGHGGFQDVIPEEYAARIVAFFDAHLLN